MFGCYRNSHGIQSLWSIFHLEQYAKTDTMTSFQVSIKFTSCMSKFMFRVYWLDPRTRVALYLQNGVPNSDYINANFIRVRKMM